MTVDYYNRLAPFYKYMHRYWNESISRHAELLDSIIKEFFGQKQTLLDVSCGIGTQAVGLAGIGYAVSASDISNAELAIAKEEAAKRGLSINFSQADMREVSKKHKERFDVVLSADNSIPHLLSDADILNAFSEFYAVLKPGGGCIITVRDYENVNPEKQQFRLNPRTVHNIPGGRVVLFDLWRFDGDFYDMDTYIVKDTGGNSHETVALRSRYYCIKTKRIEELMREAGFDNVRTLKERFFQPAIIGTKP
ncbi:MAG: class I SAM-dependent methyltransferase [Elusimicrobiaceae bacterium]|jgi:ubiquinone/menaquinone biosynthesis C-methylase UbiE